MKNESLFSRISWMLWSAVIGGAITFFFLYFQFKYFRDEAQITAFRYSNQVLIDSTFTITADSLWKIQYGERVLKNALISTIEIKNTGDLTVDSIPISFEIENARFLRYSIGYPEGMKKGDIVKLESDTSSYEFVINYLNPNESIIFNFTIDDIISDNILIKSRLARTEFLVKEAHEATLKKFGISEGLTIIFPMIILMFIIREFIALREKRASEERLIESSREMEAAFSKALRNLKINKEE